MGALKTSQTQFRVGPIASDRSLNVIFAVSTIFRHMNSEGATASYSSWVHGCVVSHYILQCSFEGRVSLKAHQVADEFACLDKRNTNFTRMLEK